MATINAQHWKDRGIKNAEAVSDAFDVVKAWLAHFANWILFICLVANLIEMVSSPFAAMAGLLIIAVQSISLDVAGFGLVSMGTSAKHRGDLSSARKATGMGWALIAVMIVTVVSISVSVIWPDLKDITSDINNGLMITRVIVTVIYGYMHNVLREAGAVHTNNIATLESDLTAAQRNLATQKVELDATKKQFTAAQRALEIEKENVSSVQSKLETVQSKLSSQVSSGQEEVSSLSSQVSSLKKDLSSAKAELDTLTIQLDIKNRDGSDPEFVARLRGDLATARAEAESLAVQLAAKTRNEAGLQSDLESVAGLRHDLFEAQGKLAELARDLSSAKAEASSGRAALDAEKKKVSSLEKQVSSLLSSQVSRPAQKVSSQVSSGQQTGQSNIVQLDTRRHQNEGESVETRIRNLHKETPVQDLSGRDIAKLVGCSPTTANGWKDKIEAEEKQAM